MNKYGGRSVSFFENPVTLIDVQTTGMSPHSAHVIEFGWSIGALNKKSQLTSHFVTLPDEVSLPKKIQKLTGISQQDLNEGQMLTDLWQRFVSDNLEFRLGVGLGAVVARGHHSCRARCRITGA